MSTRKISFPGAQGAMLDARLHDAPGTPRAYALFAHCFTCTKQSLAAARVSAALAEEGIATLRFDFTGLGDSEGDFANTNFSSNVDDLVAAADFLRRSFAAPKILVGHSLGGAAVLAAGGRIPEAVAVATIAAPADVSHLLRRFTAGMPDIEAKGEAVVELEGRPFRIRRQFVDDLAGHRLTDAIAKLGKALMVFHSPVDDVVTIDHAAKIFMAAKHPRSFVSLDHADHLLTAKADAVFVASVLGAWASRYLDHPIPVTAADASSPDGVVRVTETGDSPFAQSISVGPHWLRADEPISLGGTDLGPSPYDLLLAALGACTSMTVRMYADQKKWPLERVAVALTHEKVYAKDCAACETKYGKVDHIDRRIDLEGPLDDKQRQRLLEIANKCPVHRTLHSEVLIKTELAPAATGASI
ncbi:MAG: alpha/beta fold hydrolase [Burkholderiales bacterium]